MPVSLCPQALQAQRVRFLESQRLAKTVEQLTTSRKLPLLVAVQRSQYGPVSTAEHCRTSAAEA